jgi:hypothetical protein
MVLLMSGGCQDSRSDGDSQALSGTGAPGAEVVTGTIRHIDLEGGFYGIETDDGRRLDPVNLPEEFQKDGLRIEARVQELKDRVSIRMWGTLVRIIELRRR